MLNKKSKKEKWGLVVLIFGVLPIIVGFVVANFDGIFDFIFFNLDNFWNNLDVWFSWLLENNNLLLRLFGYWLGGVVIILIAVFGIVMIRMES